ncbi:MAG: hypothetical protein ACQETI_13265 [Halobacteriota archaeon]
MGWGLERVVSLTVGRSRRYRECRRCGTSVEDDRERCPCCEADAVVTYDL